MNFLSSKTGRSDGFDATAQQKIERIFSFPHRQICAENAAFCRILSVFDKGAFFRAAPLDGRTDGETANICEFFCRIAAFIIYFSVIGKNFTVEFCNFFEEPLAKNSILCYTTFRIVDSSAKNG